MPVLFALYKVQVQKWFLIKSYNHVLKSTCMRTLWVLGDKECKLFFMLFPLSELLCGSPQKMLGLNLCGNRIITGHNKKIIFLCQPSLAIFCDFSVNKCCMEHMISCRTKSKLGAFGKVIEG